MTPIEARIPIGSVWQHPRSHTPVTVVRYGHYKHGPLVIVYAGPSGATNQARPRYFLATRERIA